MTLQKITTESAQAFHLVGTVYSFADHLKTKTVGQGDYGLHDGVRPVGFGDALDKRAVDL
jgi:hypothetical protein